MKRFCRQGHDTLVIGRGANGGCRKCASNYSMAWARRHIDKKNAAMQKWYKAHGKEYRKKNAMRTKDSARKQDWKGVMNSTGQQLSSRDYDLAYSLQAGLCANEFCGRSGKLHMDHDHKTMAFRGLLCGPCNRALGLCRESPSILKGLAAYIQAQEAFHAEIVV